MMADPTNSPDMDREEEELIAGLAMHSLDTPADYDRAQQLVESRPQAAELLRSYREVLARIDQAAAVQPPPELAAQVLAALPARDGASLPSPVSLEQRAARRRPPWTWLAAAAAAVVLVAVPTTVAVTQHQRAVIAEEQRTQVLDVLNGAGLRVDQAALASGQGELTLMSSESGAVLLGRNLSTLDATRTYQLWVIGADGKPVDAGLVASGSWSKEMPQLPSKAVVALTIEPEGGSERPTSPPLVALKS